MSYLIILIFSSFFGDRVFAAGPGANPVPDPQATPLTLEGSIEMAVHGATPVMKAENDVKASAAQLLQGYAQFLPNLQARGTYDYQRGINYYTFGAPSSVNTRNYSAGYTVSSTINLFNGLSDLSAFEAALRRRHASDFTLARAAQQVGLDVAQSFLQVVLDRKIVDIAQENLTTSREREELLKQQTQVGVRMLADLFRQQAETSADESFLITSRNKEHSDELVLLEKLRLDAARSYRIVEPPLETDGRGTEAWEGESEDALIAEALGQRPDLKASETLADAAHWDVRTNQGSYYPRLDLGFALNSGGSYLDTQLVNGVNVVPPAQEGIWNQLGNQLNYTAGLTLSWAIFDRGVTHANVARAQAAADNATIDEEDRRNQVVSEVKQALADWQAARQQLDASRKGLEAAAKAFEVMQGRYEVGSASFIDLTTAQAALVQAQANRAQALIGYALQRRAMDVVLGRS